MDLGDGQSKGEPYTTIEHYQQPTAHLTEYYFHTNCFLEIAGDEYGPKNKFDAPPLTPEEQHRDDEAWRRLLRKASRWP